jgi:hypothetical protein
VIKLFRRTPPLDRRINVQIRAIDAMFPSPSTADAEEFELAVAIDEIGSAITGGLGPNSISTGAVLSGIALIQQVLDTHVLTEEQRWRLDGMMTLLRSV